MTFVRSFSESAVELLKQEPLFRDRLYNDIITGSPRRRQKEHSFVFPAVRNGRIDFYWAGGKLYSYDTKSGFSTHHKYGSVLANNSDDYISESALINGTVRLIDNFCEGYDRIKENCELYSGLEALGVSSLYERFSCTRSSTPPIVVLDIEASFAKEDSREKDRIDMVCLDVKSGLIRFVEAKHYTNNTSLRTSKGSPAVVGQLKRYAEQIKKRTEEILESYKNHAHIINSLFMTDIPSPLAVDPMPILLIFGFDNEQREYLKENIIRPLRADEIRVYSIGEIKKSDLTTIFKLGREDLPSCA